MPPCQFSPPARRPRSAAAPHYMAGRQFFHVRVVDGGKSPLTAHQTVRLAVCEDFLEVCYHLRTLLPVASAASSLPASHRVSWIQAGSREALAGHLIQQQSRGRPTFTRAGARHSRALHHAPPQLVDMQSKTVITSFRYRDIPYWSITPETFSFKVRSRVFSTLRLARGPLL